MKLSSVEIQMLRILGSARWPISAARAGDEMWNNDSAQGQANAPYARSAGAILARLRRNGLSRKQEAPCGGGFMHHAITRQGLKELNR